MTPARSFSLVPARRIAALLALLLAAFYVTNAWQTLSVGRWHKPGAAIFPIAVGALLAISGLSVLFERRGGGDGPMPATFTLPAGADLRRLLLLLAAFALYFLVMPVIGNMVASALFLFASMWLLSDDPSSIAAAARDLRHRDRGQLRMVLRPASESADARGRVPAMAVLVRA